MSDPTFSQGRSEHHKPSRYPSAVCFQTTSMFQNIDSGAFHVGRHTYMYMVLCNAAVL